MLELGSDEREEKVSTRKVKIRNTIKTKKLQNEIMLQFFSVFYVGVGLLNSPFLKSSFLKI